MKTQIPSSVQRCLKKQESILDDAIRRIDSGTISKFDRIQFRRAIADGDEERILQVATEIQQKLLGPDFQMKAIKTNYGMLGQLRELGLQNFALYHQLIQPKVQEMMLVLRDRALELTKEIWQDPDLDKYGKGE